MKVPPLELLGCLAVFSAYPPLQLCDIGSKYHEQNILGVNPPLAYYTPETGTENSVGCLLWGFGSAFI